MDYEPAGAGEAQWRSRRATLGSFPPATACIAQALGTDPNGPNGTYQYYYTYILSDGSLESNPSPASNSVTANFQDVFLILIDTCSQPAPPGLTWYRNIYASGGDLGQPYLVGTLADNFTVAFNVTTNDVTATDQGQVMPTTNDPPPAAAGMCGPYYSRLIAWSTLAKVNRLYSTDPELPQYWPGSAASSATGNWVDVGMEGEAIIWCTMHTGILVIYKERSIWELVGDPDTGYLQQIDDGRGLVNAWSVVSGGPGDYFVAPTGLQSFNLDAATQGGGEISPLFTASIVNNGTSLTPPGSILPPPSFQQGTGNALNCYWMCLGYGLGKLYVAYAEQGVGGTWVTMIYDEMTRRWAYHRNAIGGGSGLQGFQGFIYDGLEMIGLCGEQDGAHASGYSIDDFRGFYSQDPPLVPIECVYQSHFEDCGAPDNQKNYLEVVLDYELLGGDTADVLVSFDNNTVTLAKIGTVTGTALAIPGAASARQQTSFALGNGQGILAKNISVAVHGQFNHLAVIYNVYLYYYEEARLGVTASTIPVDLGVGKVKQCKELELDIDATGGTVGVNIYSDLPGNALAVRQTPVVAKAGRAVFRYPFPITEGYLWRLALTATSGPFRLYSARLLMRIVGVYVEAYESAAGYIWDSQPVTFESGITKIPRMYQISLAATPIKRAREISLEIETFNGPVTVTFLSDIPGNQMTARQTTVINTGNAGRRFVRIPLPNGDPTPWVEGRMFQLQLSGKSKYILYEASIEILPMGQYIEAYEAAAGAVYDSREVDFGSPLVKECTELELDIETTGAVIVQLFCDVVSPPVIPNVSTTGRQKVLIPLTVNAATGQYAEGRLPRLVLSGVNAFRLYDARLKVRPISQYLLAAETTGGALWDSTVVDLGTQTVKQLRELQLDIWAYGAYTVTVYTDLPGNVMVSRVTATLSQTNGRTNVEVPLPQGGVPDNYIFGRLVRVTITSAWPASNCSGRGSTPGPSAVTSKATKRRAARFGILPPSISACRPTSSLTRCASKWIRTAQATSPSIRIFPVKSSAASIRAR